MFLVLHYRKQAIAYYGSSLICYYFIVSPLELFHKYASRKRNLAHAQPRASLVLGSLRFKGLENSLLHIFATQPRAMPTFPFQHLETRVLLGSRTSKQRPGLAHSLNCMFLWGRMDKPLSLCI